jgi:hypothetical protein
MYFASIVRKICGYFFADECVGKVCNFKGAIDAVVVCNGHVGHSPAESGIIKVEGFREALGTSDFL